MQPPLAKSIRPSQFCPICPICPCPRAPPGQNPKKDSFTPSPLHFCDRKAFLHPFLPFLHLALGVLGLKMNEKLPQHIHLELKMMTWLLGATRRTTNDERRAAIDETARGERRKRDARRTGMNGENFADCRRTLLRGGESCKGQRSGLFGNSKMAGETRS